MADTIVHSPSDRSDSAAGWAVAAVVVVAIIIGGILLFQDGLPGVPNTGTDVDVNMPTQSTGANSGGTESENLTQ